VGETFSAHALLNLRIIIERFDPMIRAVRRAREGAVVPGLRDDLAKLQVSLERARNEVSAVGRRWGSRVGTIWVDSPPTPQSRSTTHEQSRGSAL